jgi:hypothetical protein
MITKFQFSPGLGYTLLRRGDERMNARRISLTPSFAGVTEFGGDGIGPPSTNESYVWI